MPPAAGSAAELTAEVLPLVAERAEVVLVTEQESWDPALQRHSRVVRARLAEPPWAELNRADMTVFSIGGDATSGAIWRLSQRHPGVVILHDEPLWPLFLELAHDEPADRERLAAHLEQVHGPRAHDELTACLDGATSVERLAERYPLTALAAAGALAVLVGSRDAAERLAGSVCPVAEAAFPSSAGKRDPGPWVDTLAALIESARRFQPLSAARVLARALTDELRLWNGFTGDEEHAPRCDVGGPQPLHRRIVTPVADAVEELLQQTRAGRGADLPAAARPDRG